ncbi:hypothetical protein FN846DRAFT_911265 [Sphaerosporella brunnea]|uniref:Fungal-type protein kinase domain-containing protein n=1 Tax=Sphaerosporella brunnea TaxID=1250544 RepID=A0A5J5EKD7_9PEZI|nr:hypothetical protein FN846DRAFT_911265 [Sphaerosporella brunnea]
MTPLGQQLLSFTSDRRLLLALRDAILGHKHIAPPHGFLIDFDFAVSRARHSLSCAGFITGTFMYMLIDVLQGLCKEPHNAIHDLEHPLRHGEQATAPTPPATLFAAATARHDAAKAKRLYLGETPFMEDVMPTPNDTMLRVASSALCSTDGANGSRWSLR